MLVPDMFTLPDAFILISPEETRSIFPAEVITTSFWVSIVISPSGLSLIELRCCPPLINFNSTSDIRYKTNIATVLDAVDKVKNLRGVTFNWIETGSKSMGVIAQEVEEIIPEVVVGEDKKSVNYSAIIGLLIEAIKEQQREMEEIKNLLIEQDIEKLDFKKLVYVRQLGGYFMKNKINNWEPERVTVVELVKVSFDPNEPNGGVQLNPQIVY